MDDLSAGETRARIGRVPVDVEGGEPTSIPRSPRGIADTVVSSDGGPTRSSIGRATR